jgi:sulfatase maturation enzyme AslB (radical SAM superfamily)
MTMPKVDIKQTITAHSEDKTDIKVEYYRSVEDDGDVYNCHITLSNGFRVVGSVEKTYRKDMTDAEGFALAHQRALNAVEMHGYTLV